jgi:hypothetical protein
VRAAVTRSSAVWDITPCSPSKVDRRFEGIASSIFCFMLVSCLVYSLTLNMEAKYSSKTSVEFRRTIRIYVPEDIIFILILFYICYFVVLCCVNY